jgi:PAS domain S-box-containing protein
MKTEIEQFSSKNSNPVLCAEKGGTVLYSNEASEPLLQEWGMGVKERLPSGIGNLVQRVISQNSPEKMEVKVGNRVYLVVFSPLPEQECVNISGFDISDQKKLEEKIQKNESQEMANVLAEIIDIKTVQSLMDDFYKLVHIPIGLRDLKDNVLVGVGFQDICAKFHRVNPETCKYCVESGIEQSMNVLPGEYKLYKCKNNMWDILTPITVSNQHIGNIVAGQFIFNDEPLDYELFRSQAIKYDFNEEEYIAALEKVPRLSREVVNTAMSFIMTFANMLSKLSYSNTKLAQSLAEREALLEALSESEEKYRNIVETANEGITLFSGEGAITYVNKKMADILGYAVEEVVDKTIWDFVDETEKSAVTMSFEKRRLGNLESFEIKLIRKDGSPLWACINTKPLFDKVGKFIGALDLLTDITQRKKAEEALRNSEIARQKEIHHRIKNNLQVISSLLDLQAEKFKSRKDIEDLEVIEAFRESQDRVISMALIHEELYRGEGIDKLDFSSYVEKLADNLFLTYRVGNKDIILNMDLKEKAFFDIDIAIPLGIIVNELVSNSFKYAFQGSEKGEIRIILNRDENGECGGKCRNTNFTLTISDDGIGIPDNLDIKNLDSLGLQLVTSLVDQLDGEFELKKNNGTEFKIKFTVTEMNNLELEKPIN